MNSRCALVGAQGLMADDVFDPSIRFSLVIFYTKFTHVFLKNSVMSIKMKIPQDL